MARKTYIEKVIEKGQKGKKQWGIAFVWVTFMASKVPWIPRLHPWVRKDKTDMRWLPINENIQMPENAPLPLNLLDRFIEEASHRVIFDECGCRVAYRCKEYPIDIGCLLMGDSALESPMSICREVNADEAKEFARRAVEAGLVPVVGKARVDNFIFGIKDYARLLTVCFCCECCCITRFTRHTRMEFLEPIFPRLDGITIEVTDDCVACGECAKHCYIQAIKVVDDRVVIGENCRACGRCATVCPNEAIEVRIEDPEFIEKAYDRILAHTKHD